MESPVRALVLVAFIWLYPLSGIEYGVGPHVAVPVGEWLVAVCLELGCGPYISEGDATPSAIP